MEGVVSFKTRPLYPGKRFTVTYWNKKMVRPQSKYARYREEINHFRCNDSNSETSKPPRRHDTYYSIPTSFVLTAISLINNNLVINFTQVSWIE
jgi:hypothetical protein